LPYQHIKEVGLFLFIETKEQEVKPLLWFLGMGMILGSTIEHFTTHCPKEGNRACVLIVLPLNSLCDIF
jgi:hypothetical protein